MEEEFKTFLKTMLKDWVYYFTVFLELTDIAGDDTSYVYRNS